MLFFFRESGGSLVRNEDIVFLDIEGLALQLAPILNHKTDEQDEDGCPMFAGKRLDQPWLEEASRQLFETGILHRCFAGFLWGHPRSPVLEATFDVLLKLGILLPLGSGFYRGALHGDATVDHTCGRTQDPRHNITCGRGFLVLMRLPNEVPPDVASRLQCFDKEMRENWGLVSKWEFRDGSSPHGLVERIIASFHVVGDVVGGTCWRKGACFIGNVAGKKAGGGPFALVLDFCEPTGSENIPTAGTLTIQAFGTRDGRAVWGAMRFAISTAERFLADFPGLRWRAWLECPAHEGVLSHNLHGPGRQVSRCVSSLRFAEKIRRGWISWTS